MRDRELNRLEAMHPDLGQRVAAWHEAHPGGTLQEAVLALALWPDPEDRDAQYLVWRHLPEAARAALVPGGGSAHPLRDLVTETVRRRIADGTYPPGSRLPGLAVLAQEHECSPQPVKDAYAFLAGEGLIICQPRKGYWASAARAVS